MHNVSKELLIKLTQMSLILKLCFQNRPRLLLRCWNQSPEAWIFPGELTWRANRTGNVDQSEPFIMTNQRPLLYFVSLSGTWWSTPGTTPGRWTGSRPPTGESALRTSSLGRATESRSGLHIVIVTFHFIVVVTPLKCEKLHTSVLTLPWTMN